MGHVHGLLAPADASHPATPTALLTLIAITRTSQLFEQWPALPSPLPSQVGGCLDSFYAQRSAFSASETVLHSVSDLQLECLGPPSLHHTPQVYDSASGVRPQLNANYFLRPFRRLKGALELSKRVESSALSLI